MPQGLKRFQQINQLHFITFSCHHRLPFLTTPDPKHLLEQHLEHLRQTHGFDLHGYVLMPEHVHLLLSEPTHHPLTTTLKILKQETAKHLLGPRAKFWQDRYFDFNVRTEAKRIEKLKYIHRNPLKRGLTQRPEDYPWSSAHHYATGTPGTIHLASHWTTHPPPRHAKRRVPPSWQLLRHEVGHRAKRDPLPPRHPLCEPARAMIHLHLQPEFEAQLAAEAGARGLELDRYIEQIIEARPVERHKTESPAETAAAIRKLRNGIRLQDLALASLVREGRRY